MASKFALLVGRCGAVVTALSVVAAVAGYFHGLSGHGGVGFFDGPI